ncbi:MAG: leader peptide processing enzyme [Spirochaetaceae bacterium]|nr:leader peptide processing enzyme [Spirochaetaceae bacterium]MBP5329849.1 leader peptide processing enzyme [Spirochaetaceae bacterium]
MNKKQNTIFFILFGTVANIFLSFLFIILFIILGIKFFGPQNSTMVLAISFLAGMLLGMFVYRKLGEWVIRKFNLEDKLDPIFVKNRKSRKD